MKSDNTSKILTAWQEKKSLYQIFVADNHRYRDKAANYKLAEFDSFDEAVAVCRKIVDDFLQRNLKDAATADALYQFFVNFGEDPFIVGEFAPYKFSAWDYAKQRCTQICGENCSSKNAANKSK